MVRSRFAIVLLLLGAPSIPARADEAAPQTPAERAVLSGEDQAEGADIPELREPLALGGLAGKPIVRIDIVPQGGRWEQDRTTRVESVKIGEPLSAEAARRAVRELLRSGKFARASAEAYAVPEGAALRIAVLPRRRIATIQLVGSVLDRQDTLEAARVSEDGEITATLLPDVGARIRAFYAEHGYPAAKVSVQAIDIDDPSRIILSINIDPGPPRTIFQRVFVVDPRADKEIGALKQRYRLGQGARVDERAFAEADREMADVLRQNGFHNAEVSHRVHQVGPNVYLYVYLKPGPRVVPAFDGNRAFDSDTLEDALDLGETTETSPTALAERIRAFYVERGFYDAEVTPTLRGAAGDPVHYLTFTIREHEQVRVTKRVFPCLSGELTADDLGTEIESFLEEDLPGADTLTVPDPGVVSRLFGPTRGTGGRARPIELNPAMTYAPETYERARKHLRDLYFSKGYLNAVIGPISVLRATCSRRSPPGTCIPEPPKDRITAQCRTDAQGLPIPEPPVPSSLSCRPDPARHITCAPEMTLRIPVHLGPKSLLYDVVFEGNRGFCDQAGLSERDREMCVEDKAFSERWLSSIAELPVGQPLSTFALDAARLRILEKYRDLGYAFAEVRAEIEPSPDRTRARARFVITERDRVFVTGVVIKGATRTDEALIRSRVVLREGQPYRQNLARLSEERIGGLGPFSSVSISLEDPEVPQKNKRVLVHVVEQLPQYLDPQIGFSTGEGVRVSLEYGHRNVSGGAIGLSLRLQLGYVPEFLVPDEVLRIDARLLGGERVSFSDRLERRNRASITFPDIGLGPLFSLSIDGIDIYDNRQGFGLTKQALIPALTFRPRRAITAQLAVAAEVNTTVFSSAQGTQGVRTILDQLRVPGGTVIAFVQRLEGAWDGRDNPFAPTRGFLVTAGVEHVNAIPATGSTVHFLGSHLMRYTGRVAGYLRPLQDSDLVLALSLSGGFIQHLDPASSTYPDRLLYMGGVDSLRSHPADSLFPEDITQDAEGGSILQGLEIPGGAIALNPRAELRIPLTDLFQLGIFLDTGNLWNHAENFNPLKLRYAPGAGLRVNTPIGPLALDYGLNVDPRDWEDVGAFHFSIGAF